MNQQHQTHISVIMAAYNAEKFIRRSVESVLGQSYPHFELIVVDDGSRDRTLEIVSSIHDPRLKIVPNGKNLGVVASRNKASQMATGRFIAIADADDLCHPTRFAEQLSHFEHNASTLLLATEMSTLDGGEIRRNRECGSLNPRLVDWMLHIGNPVGHPSVMFRANVLQKLGSYLHESFAYAEDFDFLHRVLKLGHIRILPKYLMIYRRHGASLTATKRSEIIEKTAGVLEIAYGDLLGAGASRASQLIARYLLAAEPVADAATFRELGANLSELLEKFLRHRRTGFSDVNQIVAHTHGRWWDRVVLPSIRSGSISAGIRGSTAFKLGRGNGPAGMRFAQSVLSGAVPAKNAIRRGYGQIKSLLKPRSQDGAAILTSTVLRQCDVHREDPPVLHIVVDTEAEFDWSGPFERAHTNVGSVRAQELSQTLLSGMGFCPIYLVDYPVASQPDGYEPLLKFFKARECVIGAHLHAWTTPPFEEALNERNSYGCNLDPALEIRKLTALKKQIEEAFGARPLFFKAGRYGIGPSTFAALTELGFAVDLSILPFADLRSSGGPDFRSVHAGPYHANPELISLPMTRGQIGVLAPMRGKTHDLIQSPALKTLRLPGILSRLRLVTTVTLTPEGVPAEEQKRLIRSMFAQGQRHFVLHYHSPSLVPGNTPYVRTKADLAEFLRRIEDVCQFFVEEIGGLPGNPADLVPVDLRGLVWPARDGGPSHAASAPLLQAAS